jgi:hypothetical protein
LQVLRNRILRLLKIEFPKSSHFKRGLLQHSQVVIRLLFEPVCADDGHDVDEVAEFWGVQPRYYHLSDMSFNPYEPMLAECYECNEEERDLANVLGDELALKVGSHYPYLKRACVYCKPVAKVQFQLDALLRSSTRIFRYLGNVVWLQDAVWKY